MNIPISDIQHTTEEGNLRAFQTFVNQLQNTFDQENNHAFASVSITCYRTARIDHYRGIILLITGGYGIGNIRISDGENELMNEQVYHVLERKDKYYSLGRSNNVLTVECEADLTTDIFRIDFDEWSDTFTGKQSIWHQLETLAI